MGGSSLRALKTGNVKGNPGLGEWERLKVASVIYNSPLNALSKSEGNNCVSSFSVSV